MVLSVDIGNSNICIGGLAGADTVKSRSPPAWSRGPAAPWTSMPPK